MLKVFSVRQLYILAVFIVMILSCEPENKPETPDGEQLPPEKYRVYEMNIQVDGNAPVISKESVDYLSCTVKFKGSGSIIDYQGTARIRGRGNSSWFWYDKKPYRIKLDAAYGLLGMKPDRDWVLLANFRDPTDLMNVFGFEVSQWLGLPFTNESRFVELTLNGDYIGLYQLTEQIEQGGQRVDVDKTNGILICLDADDGPALNPNAGDNFWSTVFEMPVCVKHPEEPTADQLMFIRNEFATLETAIKNYDYHAVAALMDIGSLIDYLIVQELVYNVEIDAPRSVFIHKDAEGKYVMGPVWDFDAGFDFDWGTMYTGHNFFNEQELVLGTDPSNHVNGYRVPAFFTQLFKNHQFVTEYKARWNAVKESIFEYAWAEMESYTLSLEKALARDADRWPIDRNFVSEMNRMKEWLTDRMDYLDIVINGYPEGNMPVTRTDCGSLSIDIALSYAQGYDQQVTIDIDKDTLISMLQVDDLQLNPANLNIVPLNADGSEGINNTNGIYGAWFESDNEPGFWANGHVYIEIFENVTSWNCGLRSESGFCSVGEKHHVRMQFQYIQGSVAKTVTIHVNFTIVE